MVFKTQYKAGQYKLTIDEINRIINSTTNLRDKLIIESLYYPALRRFEVVNLDIRDIDYERKRITIKGKFEKIAPIPVGTVYPQYIHNLKLYIGKRNSGFVFLSTHNRRFELSRINQIVQKTAELAGVKNPNPRRKHINPHIFRHSQARHLKDRGFPIEFVQNYLRHDSIKSTMDIYGTLSIDEMEKIAENKRILSP